MAYICRIKNKITKKSYIGESKCNDVIWRWNQHKRKIEKNKGCPALRDAVKKYGIENFEFSVLIICFDDDRFNYEKEYIKKYNTVVPNGYNITTGGEGGGFQGHTHTEQAKAAIKNSLKHKYADDEVRNQISEKNNIIMKTPETKEKIITGMSNSEKWKKVIEERRAGNYKKNKHGQETKDKISEGLKFYYVNNSNTTIKNSDPGLEIDNKLGKKIKQYDMNNNLLNEYVSLRSAARKTCISRSTISLHLKDNTKTHGREFIWKYS